MNEKLTYIPSQQYYEQNPESYTSDSEFNFNRRVHTTSEVPVVDIYENLHSIMQNDMWKWFLGWNSVTFDVPFNTRTNGVEYYDEQGYLVQPSNAKYVNGLRVKNYSETPTVNESTLNSMSTEDRLNWYNDDYWNETDATGVYLRSRDPYLKQVSGVRYEVNGTLLPDYDLLLHEAYRYLDVIYPDSPDYLKILTNNEFDDAILDAASFIDWAPDLDTMDWITRSMKMTGDVAERESAKLKIRNLLKHALNRKLYGSYASYKMIGSDLMYNLEPYQVATYLPVKYTEVSSQDSFNNIINTKPIDYDWKTDLESMPTEYNQRQLTRNTMPLHENYQKKFRLLDFTGDSRKVDDTDEVVTKVTVYPSSDSYSSWVIDNLNAKEVSSLFSNGDFYDYKGTQGFVVSIDEVDTETVILNIDEDTGALSYTNEISPNSRVAINHSTQFLRYPKQLYKYNSLETIYNNLKDIPQLSGNYYDDAITILRTETPVTLDTIINLQVDNSFVLNDNEMINLYPQDFSFTIENNIVKTPEDTISDKFSLTIGDIFTNGKVTEISDVKGFFVSGFSKGNIQVENINIALFRAEYTALENILNDSNVTKTCMVLDTRDDSRKIILYGNLHLETEDLGESINIITLSFEISSIPQSKNQHEIRSIFPLFDEYSSLVYDLLKKIYIPTNYINDNRLIELYNVVESENDFNTSLQLLNEESLDVISRLKDGTITYRSSEVRTFSIIYGRSRIDNYLTTPQRTYFNSILLDYENKYNELITTIDVSDVSYFVSLLEETTEKIEDEVQKIVYELIAEVTTAKNSFYLDPDLRAEIIEKFPETTSLFSNVVSYQSFIYSYMGNRAYAFETFSGEFWLNSWEPSSNNVYIVGDSGNITYNSMFTVQPDYKTEYPVLQQLDSLKKTFNISNSSLGRVFGISNFNGISIDEDNNVIRHIHSLRPTYEIDLIEYNGKYLDINKDLLQSLTSFNENNFWLNKFGSISDIFIQYYTENNSLIKIEDSRELLEISSTIDVDSDPYTIIFQDDESKERMTSLNIGDIVQGESVENDTFITEIDYDSYTCKVNNYLNRTGTFVLEYKTKINIFPETNENIFKFKTDLKDLEIFNDGNLVKNYLYGSPNWPFQTHKAKIYSVSDYNNFISGFLKRLDSNNTYKSSFNSIVRDLNTTNVFNNNQVAIPSTIKSKGDLFVEASLDRLLFADDIEKLMDVNVLDYFENICTNTASNVSDNVSIGAHLIAQTDNSGNYITSSLNDYTDNELKLRFSTKGWSGQTVPRYIEIGTGKLEDYFNNVESEMDRGNFVERSYWSSSSVRADEINRVINGSSWDTSSAVFKESTSFSNEADETLLKMKSAGFKTFDDYIEFENIITTAEYLKLSERGIYSTDIRISDKVFSQFYDSIDKPIFAQPLGEYEVYKNVKLNGEQDTDLTNYTVVNTSVKKQTFSSLNDYVDDVLLSSDAIFSKNLIENIVNEQYNYSTYPIFEELSYPNFIYDGEYIAKITNGLPSYEDPSNVDYQTDLVDQDSVLYKSCDSSLALSQVANTNNNIIPSATPSVLLRDADKWVMKSFEYGGLYGDFNKLESSLNLGVSEDADRKTIYFYSEKVDAENTLLVRLLQKIFFLIRGSFTINANALNKQQLIIFFHLYMNRKLNTDIIEDNFLDEMNEILLANEVAEIPLNIFNETSTNDEIVSLVNTELGALISSDTSEIRELVDTIYAIDYNYYKIHWFILCIGEYLDFEIPEDSIRRDLVVPNDYRNLYDNGFRSGDSFAITYLPNSKKWTIFKLNSSSLEFFKLNTDYISSMTANEIETSIGRNGTTDTGFLPFEKLQTAVGTIDLPRKYVTEGSLSGELTIDPAFTSDVIPYIGDYPSEDESTKFEGIISSNAIKYDSLNNCIWTTINEVPEGYPFEAPLRCKILQQDNKFFKNILHVPVNYATIEKEENNSLTYQTFLSQISGIEFQSYNLTVKDRILKAYEVLVRSSASNNLESTIFSNYTNFDSYFEGVYVDGNDKNLVLTYTPGTDILDIANRTAYNAQVYAMFPAQLEKTVDPITESVSYAKTSIITTPEKIVTFRDGSSTDLGLVAPSMSSFTIYDDLTNDIPSIQYFKNTLLLEGTLDISNPTKITFQGKGYNEAYNLIKSGDPILGIKALSTSTVSEIISVESDVIPNVDGVENSLFNNNNLYIQSTQGLYRSEGTLNDVSDISTNTTFEEISLNLEEVDREMPNGIFYDEDTLEYKIAYGNVLKTLDINGTVNDYISPSLGLDENQKIILKDSNDPMYIEGFGNFIEVLSKDVSLSSVDETERPNTTYYSYADDVFMDWYLDTDVIFEGIDDSTLTDDQKDELKTAITTEYIGGPELLAWNYARRLSITGKEGIFVGNISLNRSSETFSAGDGIGSDSGSLEMGLTFGKDDNPVIDWVSKKGIVKYAYNSVSDLWEQSGNPSFIENFSSNEVTPLSYYLVYNIDNILSLNGSDSENAETLGNYINTNLPLGNPDVKIAYAILSNTEDTRFSVSIKQPNDKPSYVVVDDSIVMKQDWYVKFTINIQGEIEKPRLLDLTANAENFDIISRRQSGITIDSQVNPVFVNQNSNGNKVALVNTDLFVKSPVSTTDDQISELLFWKKANISKLESTINLYDTLSSPGDSSVAYDIVLGQKNIITSSLQEYLGLTVKDGVISKTGTVDPAFVANEDAYRLIHDILYNIDIYNFISDTSNAAYGSQSATVTGALLTKEDTINITFVDNLSSLGVLSKTYIFDGATDELKFEQYINYLMDLYYIFLGEADGEAFLPMVETLDKVTVSTESVIIKTKNHEFFTLPLQKTNNRTDIENTTNWNNSIVAPNEYSIEEIDNRYLVRNISFVDSAGLVSNQISYNLKKLEEKTSCFIEESYVQDNNVIILAGYLQANEAIANNPDSSLDVFPTYVKSNAKILARDSAGNTVKYPKIYWSDNSGASFTEIEMSPSEIIDGTETKLTNNPTTIFKSLSGYAETNTDNFNVIAKGIYKMANEYRIGIYKDDIFVGYFRILSEFGGNTVSLVYPDTLEQSGVPANFGFISDFTENDALLATNDVMLPFDLTNIYSFTSDSSFKVQSPFNIRLGQDTTITGSILNTNNFEVSFSGDTSTGSGASETVSVLLSIQSSGDVPDQSAYLEDNPKLLNNSGSFYVPKVVSVTDASQANKMYSYRDSYRLVQIDIDSEGNPVYGIPKDDSYGVPAIREDVDQEVYLYNLNEIVDATNSQNNNIYMCDINGNYLNSLNTSDINIYTDENIMVNGLSIANFIKAPSVNPSYSYKKENVEVTDLFNSLSEKMYISKMEVGTDYPKVLVSHADIAEIFNNDSLFYLMTKWPVDTSNIPLDLPASLDDPIWEDISNYETYWTSKYGAWETTENPYTISEVLSYTEVDGYYVLYNQITKVVPFKDEIRISCNTQIPYVSFLDTKVFGNTSVNKTVDADSIWTTIKNPNSSTFPATSIFLNPVGYGGHTTNDSWVETLPYDIDPKAFQNKLTKNTAGDYIYIADIFGGLIESKRGLFFMNKFSETADYPFVSEKFDVLYDDLNLGKNLIKIKNEADIANNTQVLNLFKIEDYPYSIYMPNDYVIYYDDTEIDGTEIPNFKNFNEVLLNSDGSRRLSLFKLLKNGIDKKITNDYAFKFEKLVDNAYIETDEVVLSQIPDGNSAVFNTEDYWLSLKENFFTSFKGETSFKITVTDNLDNVLVEKTFLVDISQEEYTTTGKYSPIVTKANNVKISDKDETLYDLTGLELSVLYLNDFYSYSMDDADSYQILSPVVEKDPLPGFLSPLNFSNLSIVVKQFSDNTEVILDDNFSFNADVRQVKDISLYNVKDSVYKREFLSEKDDTLVDLAKIDILVGSFVGDIDTNINNGEYLDLFHSTLYSEYINDILTITADFESLGVSRSISIQVLDDDPNVQAFNLVRYSSVLNKSFLVVSPFVVTQTEPELVLLTKDVYEDSKILVEGLRGQILLKEPTYNSLSNLVAKEGRIIDESGREIYNYDTLTGPELTINDINSNYTQVTLSTSIDDDKINDGYYHTLIFHILPTKDGIIPVNRINNPSYFMEVTGEDIDTFGYDRVYMNSLAYPEQPIKIGTKLYNTENSTEYYAEDIQWLTKDEQLVYEADSEGYLIKYVGYVDGHLVSERLGDETGDLSLDVIGDIDLRHSPRKPIYTSTLQSFLDEFYVENSDVNPFWQFIKIEDVFDNVTGKWTQFTKIQEQSKNLGNVVLVDVDEDNRYTEIFRGLQPSYNENLMTVTESDYIDYKNGVIRLILGQPSQKYRTSNTMIKYGILYKNSFYSSKTETRDNSSVWDTSCTLKSKLKLSYMVNSTESLSNGIENASVVRITEMGLFDENYNLIAYATFPPIEYRSRTQHVSFTLYIRNESFKLS